MRRGNQTQTQTNHTMKSLHNPGYIISTSSCLGAGFAVVEDAVTIATKEVWSALDIRLRVTMVTTHHVVQRAICVCTVRRTLQCTTYTVRRTLYDVHCTVYVVLYLVYFTGISCINCIQCTLYSI